MKLNVLLVEDDIWLAQLYIDILEKEGEYSVLHAPSAEKALTILDGSAKVNLIILDMFLPDHNGVELLHEIASYSDLSKLPIIVLTSVSERDFGLNEERWKQYGVEQYLYKPSIKPGNLLVAVKKLFLKLEVQT